MALTEKAISKRLDDGAPGRHDPEMRRRLSAPAMRTFLNVCEAWNLRVNEQRGLLARPARSHLTC
jgi:hypothetical protein